MTHGVKLRFFKTVRHFSECNQQLQTKEMAANIYTYSQFLLIKVFETRAFGLFINQSQSLINKYIKGLFHVYLNKFEIAVTLFISH